MVTKLEKLKEDTSDVSGKNDTSHLNTWNPEYKSTLEIDRHTADAIRKLEVMEVTAGSFKEQRGKADIIS